MDGGLFLVVQRRGMPCEIRRRIQKHRHAAAVFSLASAGALCCQIEKSLEVLVIWRQSAHLNLPRHCPDAAQVLLRDPLPQAGEGSSGFAAAGEGCDQCFLKGYIA